MRMYLIIQFCMSKKDINITIPAMICMVIFCFNVMVFFCMYFDKCFLYNFVCTNQSLNFCEPLPKQNNANNMNGVVGIPGSTIPTKPTATAINPAIIYKAFVKIITTPP